MVWQSRGQRPRLTWNFPPQMAGHYTLSVTNHGTQPLQLVTAPATYRLLPHAIIGHANQYLQFRVQQQSVAPSYQMVNFGCYSVVCGSVAC
ncbi:hypothetical protein L3X07_06080 [Levilactobacillus brevis]|nr:hypothetical protein [Levilactobacillus brevis]